jgi:hypothetical protein
MVPTLVLDEMIRVAGIYGSKIALIGDYAQMGAPEAGGLLRDLAATPAAVELTAVRRFPGAVGGRCVAATSGPQCRRRVHLPAGGTR